MIALAALADENIFECDCAVDQEQFVMQVGYGRQDLLEPILRRALRNLEILPFESLRQSLRAREALRPAELFNHNLVTLLQKHIVYLDYVAMRDPPFVDVFQHVDLMYVLN